MTSSELLLLSMAHEGGGAQLFFVDGRYVWRANSMGFDENDDEVWRDSSSEPFDGLAAALLAWADAVLCSVPTFVEATRIAEIGSVVSGILERASQNVPATRAASLAGARWQAIARGDAGIDRRPGG